MGEIIVSREPSAMALARWTIYFIWMRYCSTHARSVHLWFSAG